MDVGHASPENESTAIRRNRWRYWAIGLVLLAIVSYMCGSNLMWFVPSKAGGSETGSLCGCPSSPNCVSSQAADPLHQIEPLRFVGEWQLAKQRLLDVLASLPRVRIVKNEGPYIHATFTSLVCRFVDDVEFLFDPSGHQIEVRSLSRVGYSDLGANRQRVETLRRQFESGR